MKKHFSAAYIHNLQGWLGLTVAEFASLLFVHTGTVHRWKAGLPRTGSGDAAESVPVDGFAGVILSAFEEIDRVPSGRIRRTLVTRGPLAAIRIVIGLLEHEE